MSRKPAVLLVPLVLSVLSVFSVLAPASADPRLEALARSPAGMEALLADGSAADEVIDRACGVRDCRDIRLFWHTDLEAAKVAARAEGKPILSLRLLGRLDEELSCANSRFFRTVYYTNRGINELLRERYILHWRSVRPVPRVTIDFGDGMKLERTLTGNSIHYVLDSRGRLIEALPGLSGPDAFRTALVEAEQAARQAGLLDDTAFAPWLARHHRSTLQRREAEFLRETVRDPWEILRLTPGVMSDRLYVGGLETASKMASEAPLVSALDDVTDATLHAIAGQRRPRIHLDDASRAFLLRKQGVTDPAEAERLVDSFETTLALDEVINEYRMEPAILKKLSRLETLHGLELEAFNQWVYEEVFRQPLSDPWLGLAPADVYVALPASTRKARPE